jgi:hypothetical protein
MKIRLQYVRQQFSSRLGRQAEVRQRTSTVGLLDPDAAADRDVCDTPAPHGVASITKTNRKLISLLGVVSDET